MSKTREDISRGTTANDGTGDDLRSAAGKINNNFGKIWEKLGGDSDVFYDHNVVTPTLEMTANGAISLDVSYTIFNKATALAATLADAASTGQLKYFTNKGAGLVTVTPANFSLGTSFSVPQNSGAQTIWDGTNWHLVGHDSAVSTV